MGKHSAVPADSLLARLAPEVDARRVGVAHILATSTGLFCGARLIINSGQKRA